MRSKPGVFRQFVSRVGGLGGAPAPTPFTPSDLFGESDYGDWWDFRTADGLFISDDGATDPVSENDPVGSAVGRLGSMTTTQSNTSYKPLWNGGLANLTNSTVGGGLRLDTLLSNTPEISGEISVYVAYDVTGVSGAFTGNVARLFTRDADGNAGRQDLRSEYSYVESTIAEGLDQTTSRSSSISSGAGFLAMSGEIGQLPYKVWASGIEETTENATSATLTSQQLSIFAIYARAPSEVSEVRVLGVVFLNGSIDQQDIDNLNEYYGVSA